MARPRSDEREQAIIAAAIRIIAADGLGAPTAAIAKAAGVSNGSLFTYFPSKADLLNRVYVDLKTEVGAAAATNPKPGADERALLKEAWTHWLRWASSFPEKRRALAHLGVSGDITEQSRLVGQQAMSPLFALLDHCRRKGPMREAPAALVLALVGSAAETTIDYMGSDPARAEAHSEIAFEAVWRMLA